MQQKQSADLGLGKVKHVDLGRVLPKDKKFLTIDQQVKLLENQLKEAETKSSKLHLDMETR